VCRNRSQHSEDFLAGFPIYNLKTAGCPDVSPPLRDMGFHQGQSLRIFGTNSSMQTNPPNQSSRSECAAHESMVMFRWPFRFATPPRCHSGPQRSPTLVFPIRSVAKGGICFSWTYEVKTETGALSCRALCDRAGFHEGQQRGHFLFGLCVGKLDGRSSNAGAHVSPSLRGMGFRESLFWK
jgi:hypothetical protein